MGECLCQPPCSCVTHLVKAEVQSDESGVVAAEPVESIVQLRVFGSHLVSECQARLFQKKRLMKTITKKLAPLADRCCLWTRDLRTIDRLISEG